MLLLPSMFNAQLLPPNLPLPFVGFVKPFFWGAPPQTSCPNGNFEEGVFSSGFTGYTGNRSGLGYTSSSSYVQGYVNGRHEIVSTGFDPLLGGSLLPMTHDGMYAAKIGRSNLGNASSTSLNYKFIVTPENKSFSFNYAIVMGDPVGGHSDIEKPYFGYAVISTSPFSVIKDRKFISDVTNPYYNTAPNNVVWRNWSTECIDLSSYVGKEITIIFEVASCGQSAPNHFSYAYIDGLCTDNDAKARFYIKKNLCANKTIKLYGSGSRNEDSYFIGIQKSDGNWHGIGLEYSKWFVAQEVGTVDLTQLFSSLGGEFECNSHYRIKLAVSNNCTSWVEKNKLIYVRCPDVPDLENKAYCCQLFNDNIDLGFENQSYPNYTFNWTAVSPIPNSFQVNGNGETITTVPYLSGQTTYNSTFNVEVRDNYGCTIDQDITLRMVDALDLVNIEEVIDANNCCSKVYKANLEFIGNCAAPLSDGEIDEYFDFTWSNGETGRTVTLDYAYQYNLSVTVSNHCGNDMTANITHTPVTPSVVVYDGSSLIAPNSIIPSSSNPLRNHLFIGSFGPNVPLSGNTIDDAYGISGYKLTIFNRWGTGAIRVIEETSQSIGRCYFYQDEIKWDGKDGYGHVVPTGVYPYILEVQLCGNENWIEVCEMNTRRVCKREGWRWTWWPPFREKYCVEYYPQGAGTYEGVSQCRYHVKVIR